MCKKIKKEEFKTILVNQGEKIQEDLSCILDGLEDSEPNIYNSVFEVITDRFKLLKDMFDQIE